MVEATSSSLSLPFLYPRSSPSSPLQAETRSSLPLFFLLSSLERVARKRQESFRRSFLRRWLFLLFRPGNRLQFTWQHWRRPSDRRAPEWTQPKTFLRWSSSAGPPLLVLLRRLRVSFGRGCQPCRGFGIGPRLLQSRFVLSRGFCAWIFLRSPPSPPCSTLSATPRIYIWKLSATFKVSWKGVLLGGRGRRLYWTLVLCFRWIALSVTVGRGEWENYEHSREKLNCNKKCWL